jgi:hypothetical protein
LRYRKRSRSATVRATLSTPCFVSSQITSTG